MTLFGKASYPFTEMQSVYSIAPANWILVKVRRDATNVLCLPGGSALNIFTLHLWTVLMMSVIHISWRGYLISIPSSIYYCSHWGSPALKKNLIWIIRYQAIRNTQQQCQGNVSSETTIHRNCRFFYSCFRRRIKIVFLLLHIHYLFKNLLDTGKNKNRIGPKWLMSVQDCNGNIFQLNLNRNK